ncbi:response regulator transcription factor, partial [Bradyrhizobium sp.]|uniref:response regulator transcription factor n=1 Tax=Bradyrhizobium sp. TaxID=376 RepID=UPI00391ADACE
REDLGGANPNNPHKHHQNPHTPPGGERAPPHVHTPPEFEVMQMLLAERTTEEIASALHLSPKTIANLHSLIKDKLGVGTDIELVRLALRQGLLT